ncbi:guanylate cyclase, partial [candidate division TA06 bacterium]
EIETRFGAAVARGLSRFVGRQKEITALKEAFDKAKAGSGQVVGVVGEAGVGKTRLLLELRESLSQEQYTYLEGRCLHYGSSMPYLPILDTLREYFDIKDIERESVIKRRMKKAVKQLDVNTDTVLSPLHDILSLQVEDEEYLNLEPQQKRERTFEAIKSLLIALSQSEPLILAVEDLHWIDKTSDEFLYYLIGSLANARILLILLYRPEYTHSWASRSSYSQVRVDELTVDPSIELVQSILEVADVASDLRELVLSRAAGNPLFIEELTHNLLENGFIHRNNGQYVLSTRISDIQVPETIQGIIAARMDRLEDDLKRTMQIASVIGRDFAYRILRTITGMQDELKSHLLSLQGLEFIYEKSLFPELEYIFKHALTQEVAYESLLVKRRKELHEKTGEAIEELYSEMTEEFYEVLAHHYSKSENHEKSYQYLKLSGDKAAQRYSPWEAFRFYKAALDALRVLPDSEQRKRRGIEVRLSMLISMLRLGYPEDSLTILEEGERLCRELGDEMSLTSLASAIGTVYAFEGNTAQARKYNETAFQAAENADDIQLVIQIGEQLCGSYTLYGLYPEVIKVAPKVISSIERSQREGEIESNVGGNTYSMLLAHYGHAIGFQGDFEQGATLCEKGLNFALQLNDPVGLSYIEVFYGTLYAIKGDSQRSAEHYKSSIRYCEEIQNYVLLGGVWVLLGEVYRQLGELETARHYIEKGLKIYQDAGMPDLLAHMTYGFLGVVYTDEGDLEIAGGYIEKSLKVAQDCGARLYEAWWRIWLSRTFNRANISESALAEASMLQAIEIFRELKIKPWCAIAYSELGALYADTGQTEKALETLKKAEGMMQEMGMGY